MVKRNSKLLLPLVAVLALGACENVTGSGDETRVLLARSGSSASLAPAFYAAVSSAMPPATLDKVESINITITEVRAFPQGTEDGEGVTLTVTTPAPINFLSLPTATAGTGIQLAKGEVPAGTYGNLKLKFSTAEITFKEEVTVGQVTYPASTPITLMVPSGRIHVPGANITVPETGTDIQLVFDAATSVKNIVATGADKVIMTPVLGAREVE